MLETFKARRRLHQAYMLETLVVRPPWTKKLLLPQDCTPRAFVRAVFLWARYPCTKTFDGPTVPPEAVSERFSYGRGTPIQRHLMDRLHPPSLCQSGSAAEQTQSGSTVEQTRHISLPGPGFGLGIQVEVLKTI